MTTLRQREVDAISARILHEKRIKPLRQWSVFADWFAVAVPIWYLAVRLLAKDTQFEKTAEVSWEVVATILLIVALSKIILRIDTKADTHAKLMGENISLIMQARNLQADPSVSREALQAFEKDAAGLEMRDRESLGPLSETIRQETFRLALRELGHHTVCPICASSPWKFQPGTCQACGNTPQTEIGRDS